MPHTSTPSVAIIVLNWNGIEDTLLCLNSLLVQDFLNFQVIVVDNGSSDNSKEVLDQYQNNHSAKINVISNPINLGFAGGVNMGIRWAMDNEFECVALLNNDAVAKKDWLINLVNVIKPKGVGVSVGLLLRKDGKTIDSAGESYSKWGLSFPRSRGVATKEAPKKGLVFGATGGASLYKTELFRNIGLFDEDFFAYYEDADISFRAQLAGWKVAYTPAAVAYHKQGATSGKVPGFTTYQTFKNLPLLFLKNTPRQLLLPMGVRFYLAYWLIFGNAVAHGTGIPATKGLIMSFLLGFKKLGARRKIQKNTRVTVKYIKSILWYDLPPDQTGLRKFRRFFTGK